uniref:ATP synthase complex subunit 8 n=1 Tax=Ochthebius griotes TaxID=1309725 RepID=A0A7H0DKC2_9COLE|nr:ATP synthase F0 subunit 8 [Ochthebius griotes]QNP09782.1 ATP synthase F0 subunit 8 [Ochthebius griotes]
MPQMAPMNWILLFMMFTIIFLMFNSMNYFSFKYNNNMTNISKKKMMKLNWKW